MGIRLNAFGATSDVEAIDKTLAMMESYPNFVWDWTVYNNAASSYAKAGLLDKALEMLKKSEELILETKCFRAYEFLITQYSKFGKKDDVIRLWELYKKNQKVYNKGYACVISSLLRFDDLESAKKIFDEWESENEYYDIRIVNFLIGAYSRKGLLQEAKNLIDGAKLKGGKPNQTTWLYIAVGYFQNNETQKAVVAMEEALVICKLGWKPRKMVDHWVRLVSVLAWTLLAYNVLLNLYYQTANYKKHESHIHEMQEKGIGHDKFTMGIRLSAFGATSDVEGIDKTGNGGIRSQFCLRLESLQIAASGNTEAGLLDKAAEMLKKSEELITGKKSNRAYEFLTTHSAKFGKKDDVLRLLGTLQEEP
ncbi:hypothetical protein Pint_36299 [Pistacia integerrima]|uniref:Uncharacterized protein n=1 Tax=Pistacia integerrima TaxID=434235 RepID=A0ACC0XZX8_9ROSI|nr:hypothetical protein Pint_36299 [Pistacia integerrima]